jgi:FkbM family methyltransferase
MLIPEQTLLPFLKDKVTGAIHIGAHTCEELQFYYNLNLNDKNIVWFEANPKLVEENKRRLPNIQINQAMLAENDGEERSFMITNNGQSSSFLEFGTHKDLYREVHEIDRIKLKTSTLDSYKLPSNYNFMNIDVQGAELHVLKGALETLKHIDFLYVEVNIHEVYVGCGLMHEVDALLEPFGFVKEIDTVSNSSGWGDVLYIKKTNN